MIEAETWTDTLNAASKVGQMLCNTPHLASGEKKERKKNSNTALFIAKEQVHESEAVEKLTHFYMTLE